MPEGGQSALSAKAGVNCYTVLLPGPVTTSMALGSVRTAVPAGGQLEQLSEAATDAAPAPASGHWRDLKVT